MAGSHSGSGEVKVAVSPGELIDKIGILEIKAARFRDADKRRNVARDLARLAALRGHEARGDFGPAFVTLARAVYQTNDRRSALKRRIDQLLGAAIVEEKEYAAY